jgi:hypothetical protein
LPSTAIACESDDGLLIVIVTLPDFALSTFLLNLRALGSADRLSLVPAPLVDAGVVAAAAGAELGVVEVLPPPPPHPAAASAAAAAAATSNVGLRVKFRSS